jgi:CBS-domain-containing membrane protein
MLSIPKTLSNLLESTPISSIKRGERELITLSPETTVEDALKKLAYHAISSAPVFDPNRQNIVGYLSALDLCVWVVRAFAQAKGDKPYNWNAVDKEFRTPVGEVMDFTIDPIWPISEDLSVSSLVSSCFKWRVHRAPVTRNKQIVGHVSQSDVVAFLASHLKEMEPLASMTLKELGLHSGPVLSVLDSTPLIKGFSDMLETKFTGLAVVDEQGKLVNNLSAADLTGMTRDTFWRLEKPIKALFDESQKLVPLSCKPETTFGRLIQTLADCRVHRIYVVDEQTRPINVITLTSIMRVFSPIGSECFT